MPHARQAIKITRRREDTATGKTTRQTVYAITSLTSARATAQNLARLAREHWSISSYLLSERCSQRRGSRQPAFAQAEPVSVSCAEWER